MDLRSAHCSSPVKRSSDLKPGDVVLINEEKLPKMGRITDVYVGRDGKVRSCLVMFGMAYGP